VGTPVKALARIVLGRIVRAATPVNAGVARRDANGIGAQSADADAIARRRAIPKK
jgi:hypothetical protein